MMVVGFVSLGVELLVGVLYSLAVLEKKDEVWSRLSRWLRFAFRRRKQVAPLLFASRSELKSEALGECGDMLLPWFGRLAVLLFPRLLFLVISPFVCSAISAENWLTGIVALSACVSVWLGILNGMRPVLQVLASDSERLHGALVSVDGRALSKTHLQNVSIKNIAILLLVLVLTWMLSALVGSLVAGISSTNPVVSYVLVGVLALFLIIYRRLSKRAKRSERTSESIDIEGGGYLIQEEYLQSIYSLVEKLNVRDVLIRVDGSSRIATEIVRCEQPRVRIGARQLEKLVSESKDHWFDVFQIVLAHELVHVAYKDPFSLKRSMRLSVLGDLLAYLVAIVLLLVPYTLGASVWIELFLIVVALWLLFASMVYGHVYGDRKYWLQMMELRADALGLQAALDNGVTDEAVRLYLNTIMMGMVKNEDTMDDELHRGKVILALIGRFHAGYVEIEDHPYADLRRRLLWLRCSGERKTWGVVDYFDHVHTVLSWLLTGRGWNGRVSLLRGKSK